MSLAGGLGIEMTADRRDHLFAVPFGRPDNAHELSAVVIEQNGRRNPDDPKRWPRGRRRVQIDRQVGYADLGIEGLYRRKTPDVDRQRDDLEIRSAELGLKVVERRHFLAAWNAPGGPDVEEHGLPPEVGQLNGFPFGVLEREVGNDIRVVGDLGRQGDQGQRRAAKGDRGSYRHEDDPPPRIAALDARRHPRSSVMSGRIVSSRTVSVTAPMCLWRMIPPASTTNVSGTP